MPVYSVGTWCVDRQAYAPQRGLCGPSINISWRQLLQRMRELRAMGYGAWRVRFEDGERDSDWSVLVECTDGLSISEVRKKWKR